METAEKNRIQWRKIYDIKFVCVAVWTVTKPCRRKMGGFTDVYNLFKKIKVLIESKFASNWIVEKKARKATDGSIENLWIK